MISVRNCTRDEGRSLGVGLQEQAPNHLKLRWLRARVVSVKDKSWLKTVAGEVQGDEQPQTTDEVSKQTIDDVKTGGLLDSRTKPEGTCLLSGWRPA